MGDNLRSKDAHRARLGRVDKQNPIHQDRTWETGYALRFKLFRRRRKWQAV